MTLKWRDDAEYLELVADLIVTDEVQNLVEFKQHHYSNRLEHSINVSYRSFL